MKKLNLTLQIYTQSSLYKANKKILPKENFLKIFDGSPEAVGLELIINSITKYSFLELKELYLMDE